MRTHAIVHHLCRHRTTRTGGERTALLMLGFFLSFFIVSYLALTLESETIPPSPSLSSMAHSMSMDLNLVEAH